LQRDEGALAEQIWSLICDAVRIRMYSDVPLGAFLSGGLDSTTVVAAMASVSERPVETFSIGFDVGAFDETGFAEIAARHFGTKHHVLRCNPDAVEVLPTLVHHYDEPFADSSAIPTYYVSKLAREYVTVALSGDGGDEIFAGYTRYDHGVARWQLAQLLPDAVVRAAFRLLSRIYPVNRRGWGILHRNSLAPLDAYLANFSIYLPRERHLLLTGTDGENGHESAHLLQRMHRLAAAAGSSDFLSQMQYVDQMLYLPDDILVKVDRASMAVSLEMRAPLLDYRIAELVATVPSDLRYRNRNKKYLLKKAVAGRVPEEILHRGKMGFGVPLKQWFRKGAAEFTRDILLSQAARERGIFRTERVRALLDGHSRNGRDFSSKIWALLFFEMWCQQWLDQSVMARAESA
jgi:asparagine synthase (glutamine-hydrolysing)